jgi:hypothetical protein
MSGLRLQRIGESFALIVLVSLFSVFVPRTVSAQDDCERCEWDFFQQYHCGAEIFVGYHGCTFGMLPSSPCSNHGEQHWCLDQHDLESLNVSPLAVSLDGTLLSLVPQDIRATLVSSVAARELTKVSGSIVRSCGGDVLVRRLIGPAAAQARTESARITI